MTQSKKHLRDGVYLGLPEQEYFDQPRLGSTDLAKLWGIGLGYWWQSPMNPHASVTRSEFLDRGHALHCRLLEGPKEYAARFAIEPDKRAFPGLLVTVDDIKAALTEAGAPHPSSPRKKDLVHYAKTYLRDRPIWDDIYTRFTVDHEGKTIIGNDTGRYVDHIAATVETDPHLAALVRPDGERLTELSVLWTHGDVQLRFRFDALYPAFNLDLKSLETLPGDSLQQAAGKRIRNLHLDVQMSLSFEARLRMYEHIVAGRIHGGTRKQRDYLKRFPTQAPPWDKSGNPIWGWLWLFTQWPNESSGRAPEILPVWTAASDQAVTDGRRKYLHALDTYTNALAQFGTDRPWARAHAVHGLRGTGPQLPLPPDYGPPVMPHRDEDHYKI